MDARNRRRQEQLQHGREREERRRARQLSRAHAHLHQPTPVPGSEVNDATGGIDEYGAIPSRGSNGGSRMPLGSISVNKADSRFGGAGNDDISPQQLQQQQRQQNNGNVAILPAGNSDGLAIRPLMTIEAAVPSSAMSTLTTPTLISPNAAAAAAAADYPSHANAILPQSHAHANDGIYNTNNNIYDDEDHDDENIPPMRPTNRTGVSNNNVNNMALVSPDGYNRRTTNNNARGTSRQSTAAAAAAAFGRIPSAALSNSNTPMSSSSSVEQSSIDNNHRGGRRRHQQHQQQHPQGFAITNNDYDERSITSSSSDSEMSMLSTALSVAGIDLDDHHHHTHRHNPHHRHHNPIRFDSRSSTRPSSTDIVGTAASSSHNRHEHNTTNNDRDLNIHRGDSSSSRNARPTSQAAVNDLKIRLAETATQLTTVEDELRQRVEVEGSLRFAVDILRNRLNIRRVRDNKRRGEGGGTGSGGTIRGDASTPQDLEEKEELEIVTDMLSELGLSGPPSQQAALIARQMEDSELRTEGLRSRLAKSEKERTAVEQELKERNQSISELRAELHTVKSKLTIAERRAEKDKAKLEKRCNSLDSSKKVLKDELQRFKSQLELVADMKPGDDYDDAVAAAAAAIAASGDKSGVVEQLSLHQTASAEEQETLEARAKAKVLLSLRKEADFTYQGAVKDLEAMISQVYKQELKAEIDAANKSGENVNGKAKKREGPQELEATQRLSELSSQRLDEVGEDFKLLLSTRNRMLQLHEKIKNQCDSILTMSENANETERGRRDSAAPAVDHPSSQLGAC